jgi:hypothetical protein
MVCSSHELKKISGFFFFFGANTNKRVGLYIYIGGSFPLLILMEDKMEEELEMLPNTRLVELT